MRREQVFRSERKFQVWHYTVSHSQLLLRSNKEDKQHTRIEILFKNVGYMSIIPAMEGLTITEVDHLEHMPISVDFCTTYELVSGVFVGHVVGIMFVGEDHLEHFDPTFFSGSFLGDLNSGP